MTKNLTLILVVSLLTCSVETDISVPSFPDISDYFDISDGLTQMTIAVNFLGFCLSSAIYGPASDAFGRRKVMLIGNAIMLVGACGCAIANSIEFLLFSRLIQGIGASTSAVVAFAIIADVYSADKSSRLIGTMNSLITIFMSMAPVAGGFINELIGWRGNYTTIAAISVISWIMLYFWLPETKEQFSKLNIKKIVKDFATLLSDSRFMLSSSVPSLSFSGWMSFVACGSFLYMETYNLPIMYYALHQGAIIAVFSCCSLYSGKIKNLIGEVNCIIYGALLTITSGVSMLIISLTSENAPYLTTFSMILYSSGASILYPVVFARSLEIFPEIKGTASSAIMVMRALMCAVFISLSSYFYSGKLLSVAVMVLIASVLMSIFSRILLKILPFATN